MLIDKIIIKAEQSAYFNELFDKLEKLNYYSFLKSAKKEEYIFSDKELNDILRFADIFASSSESKYKNYANRIVSNLQDFYCNNDMFNSYAVSIFTKMGLFPSIEILNKSKREILIPQDIEFLETYKKQIQYDKELDIYYTDKQFEVVKEIQKKNNFSLSAPTSFGKTMIISNFINKVIKTKRNCNICILVPTNALLKEISTNMKTRYESDQVKVIIYPEIKEKDRRYENLIFVFTPERLVSYYAKNTLDIDYLFVDEAQKMVKENDERAPVFYNAISYASYRGSKLFFLSPNIEKPEMFLSLSDRDESSVKKISDKLVVQNRYLFDFGTRNVKYLNYKNEIIEDNLLEDGITSLSMAIKHTYKNYLNDTSTIVYFSSKTKMSEVLLDYLNNENKTEDEEILNLIKVVKETVHEKYYLVKALEHGIAYHYGQMPKAIREKIEDLFRRKVIKLIFTTSTLLEGVNIQAKNIILTSDNNGLSDLTEEDFLNLIGRAGRFRSELYGNVICLKGAFEKSQRYKYFSSQNVSNLSSEVLSAIRGNFYKDIKQIIQGRQPITKNLEEEHKKKLIREQYANIAILHNKMNYNSKLKTNLIRATSDPNVFKFIDKNVDSVDKLESFKEYTTIPIKYQQKVFSTHDAQIFSRFQEFDGESITYDDIVFLTEKIMTTYEFYKRGLIKYEKSYNYYANLIYNWIDGTTIAYIIKNTIDKIGRGEIAFLLDEYYVDGHRYYKDYIGDDRQINLIINDILEKVENDIKHLCKTYFANYIYLNVQNRTMNAKMEKIADYMEFGTKNYKTIELQKFGFSRELSIYVLRKHSECLEFIDSELDKINFGKLFDEFNKENALYEELKEYQYLKI